MHPLLEKLCAGEILASEEFKALASLPFSQEGKKEINSALSVAIEGNSTIALKTLLMLGANANLPCGSQKTSLQFAAEKGRAECVKELLLMARASAENMGWALVIATQNGHADFAKNLISHGNPPIKSIEAALIIAAQKGHADCIKSLIANSELSTEIINQALIIAVENNDANFVREIMFVGRPSFTSIGEALTAAAAKNHLECVKELMLIGKLEAQTIAEVVLLFLKNKELEGVKTFLEVISSDNYLPENKKYIKKIRDHLETGFVKLFLDAVQAEEVDFLRGLFNYKNLLSKEQISFSLLFATAHNNEKSVELLSVNSEATDLATAVHLAVSCNHVKSLEKLLAAGAGVDQAGRDGQTPLNIALRNNYAECVKLLLVAGAGVASSSMGSDQKEVSVKLDTSPKAVASQKVVISESDSSSSGEESMGASGLKRNASNISGNRGAEDKGKKSCRTRVDKEVESIEDLDREFEAMQEELGLGTDFEKVLECCIMGLEDQAPTDHPE